MSQSRTTDILQRTVIIALVLIGGGCASGPSSVTAMATPISLGISSPQPSSLFVLPGGQVGVFLESDPLATVIKPNVPVVFQVVALDDLRITEVPVVIKRECSGRWYIFPQGALPDGRLGFVAHCEAVGKSDTYALAYDATTEQTTELLPYSVPGAMEFSWNPTMDRAIARFGTLFSGVLLSSVDGIEPVQATVSRDGKTISLAQGYLDGGGVYEHFTGNVNYPSWSPDGLTVALVASFDSIEKTGFERVSGKWVLVLMNTETLSTTIVADGIYEPHIVRWTGDGRHLVYGAKRSSGVQGLWLFSLSEQSSSLIAKGSFPDFILGPTDQDVYAIRCSDANTRCDEREVWHYELSESVE